METLCIVNPRKHCAFTETLLGRETPRQELRNLTFGVYSGIFMNVAEFKGRSWFNGKMFTEFSPNVYECLPNVH